MIFLLSLAVFLPQLAVSSRGMRGGGRHGRLLNMFSVVKFPNDECTGSSTKGVCVAGSECAARGGIILGSCASGFGSCCAIYKTDCTSSDFQFNLTYITNPGYPSFYTTAGTCKYTLTKTSSDICRIRLDFVDAQLASPDTKGACTTDYFTGTQVTGPTIPPICGANAGHHIYLDAGGSSSSSATFSAVLTGTTTNRQWRILVSQIECSSRSLAPQGCLQYLTGWYGTVKSFNYDTSSTYEHLTSQDYNICIRREAGYCKIGYSQTEDTDSFKLSRPDGTYNSGSGPTCANDALIIPGGTNAGTTASCPEPSQDRYCGGRLNCYNNAKTTSEIISDRIPFMLGVLLTNPEGATLNNRGFYLNYRQYAC